MIALGLNGGGDSLFESIYKSLRELVVNKRLDLESPDNCQSIRIDLVNLLIINPKKYGIQWNKNNKNHLEAMKRPGQLPWDAILLAACDRFNVQVWVHHGRQSPVIYQSESMEGNDVPIVHKDIY